jgi:hypothetical protein
MSPALLIRVLRKCSALEACLENDSNGVPCRREVMAARLADKIEKRLLFMLGIIVIKHSDTIANAKFDVIHLPLMDFTKEQKK